MEWIYAIGSALGVAIAFLAKPFFKRARTNDELLLQRMNTTEKKLEACEERHEGTTQTLLDLTGRLGKLEGEQEGVTRLAQEALDVIDRNTRANAGHR